MGWLVYSGSQSGRVERPGCPPTGCCEGERDQERKVSDSVGVRSFPLAGSAVSLGSWPGNPSTGVCGPRGNGDYLRSSCAPAASCWRWHLGGNLQGGVLWRPPSSGGRSLSSCLASNGPLALGPTRERAFSQQLFGLESGAQAAPTSPIPGRGIQSPRAGECAGSSTWHRMVQGMSSITLSRCRPCQAHNHCHGGRGPGTEGSTSSR